MTQNLKEFFEAKTDRQLIEESIQQNIVISNKIDSINKKVGFVFVIALLQVIGVMMFVLSALLER